MSRDVSSDTAIPSFGRTQPKFRFLVMSALWLTGMFLYLDRVNISLAAPYIMEDLSFSGAEMGFVLSIYYWGYVVGSLAGGIAADRLRIRIWATAFYVIWCVTTILSGLCRTVPQFIFARLGFGVAEGAVINPINKLINQWALPNERGIAYGAQTGSCYLGLVIGMPIVAWLIEVIGWRMMFVVTGIFTFLGAFLFWLLVRDRPKDHPWISNDERDLIENALRIDRVTFDANDGDDSEVNFSESLRMALGNSTFWLICIAFFFVAGMYFTNLSWLPGYLVMERGFSSLNTGTALIVPYAAAALGALICGHLGDRFGNRSILAIFSVLLTVPATLGVLLFNETTLVIAMLSLMLFFNSAAVSTLVVLLYDILPPQVIGVSCGILVGVFGGLGGVVGPLIMGYSYDLTASFQVGFFCSLVGLMLSAFILYGVFNYERRLKREKEARLPIMGP